jgi:hypothetical protein
MRPMRVSSFLLLATIFSSGCTSTPMLVSQWTNPAYESPSFKTIAVSCVDGHISIRRNCEDEFVARLRAAGVDALPSYRSFPETAKLDETKVKQMAKEAGADALSLFAPSVLRKRQRSALLTFRHPDSVFLAVMFPPHGTAGTARRAFIGMRSIPRKRPLMI